MTHQPSKPSSAEHGAGPTTAGGAQTAGSVREAPTRATVTSELLRLLLSQDGPYRRRWRSEVRRVSPSDPHQSAVAQVLAQHLWEIGEVAESDTDLPRRLKDLVARAMAGRNLSHQTLNWFVGAFAMTETDVQRLWELLEADLRSGDPHRVTSRTTVATAPADPHLDHTRTSYRTQSLIETCEVGPDRSRARHTLMHIVRAETHLEQLSYLFDTSDVEIEVVRGGTAGRPVPDPTGRFRVKIALPSPLAPGQTAALETIAAFPAGGPRLDHFRRSLRATAGGVSLEVRFDAAAVPQRVRWTELSATVPPDLLTEPVVLAPDRAVHRFLTPAQDCSVGFEWDW
ncbi:hypothetical protein FNH13_17550 [Ornithinimicrobium ciconiae]|uniref:Uncharacterized protein n=1 Tax=Ornithinimicrobium ciconiae TaxID=2594265 RepID=A0A516GEE6_9MICO|nr:hypothetical protein [Ornithinimicrobium ciconiae]QDO89907.1 hypothetical protein FNH13_17550 [Ornithinimicrobium ciconiae]